MVIKGYVLLELCAQRNLPWHDAGSDDAVLQLKRTADISTSAASYGCPQVLSDASVYIIQMCIAYLVAG